MIRATKKWLFLKLSSILATPLMIWFMVSFVKVHKFDYDQILSFFALQQNKLIFSVFIVVMFIYSALSISEIFEDYISKETTKKYANYSVYLSSLIIPFITIYMLMKI